VVQMLSPHRGIVHVVALPVWKCGHPLLQVLRPFTTRAFSRRHYQQDLPGGRSNSLRCADRPRLNPSQNKYARTLNNTM
jgi:hypothetical protein